MSSDGGWPTSEWPSAEAHVAVGPRPVAIASDGGAAGDAVDTDAQKDDAVARCAICGASTADGEPGPPVDVRETPISTSGIITVPACRFCRVNERALHETAEGACLVCGAPASNTIELDGPTGVDDTLTTLSGLLCDEHADDVRARLKRWAFNHLPEADQVYAVGIDLDDTDVHVDVTPEELAAAAERDSQEPAPPNEPPGT